MKASVLTSDRNVVAYIELRVLTVWGHFFEKVREFFEERFESDWERKTGLPWREWGNRPVRRVDVGELSPDA